MVKYLNRAVAIDSCYRNRAFSVNLSEGVDLYDLEDLAGWKLKPELAKSSQSILKFSNPEAQISERFRLPTVKTINFSVAVRGFGSKNRMSLNFPSC